MQEFAVITGASSGLGEEFARTFASRGVSTVLVARSEDKLTELSTKLQAQFNTNAIVLPLDLAEPAGRKTLVKFCNTNAISIRYLVNSAGFGSMGLFTKLDLARELKMTELNCTALQELCYSFAKMFLKDGNGTIINIASMSGFQPTPFMASYGATKSFVINFSIALRWELAKTGVNVITVCPGPVSTNFFAGAGIKRPNVFMKVHSTDFVVGKVFKAVDSKRSFVIPGLVNKFFYYSGLVAPMSLKAYIASKVFFPKDTSAVKF